DEIPRIEYRLRDRCRVRVLGVGDIDATDAGESVCRPRQRRADLFLRTLDHRVLVPGLLDRVDPAGAGSGVDRGEVDVVAGRVGKRVRRGRTGAGRLGTVRQRVELVVVGVLVEAEGQVRAHRGARREPAGAAA